VEHKSLKVSIPYFSAAASKDGLFADSFSVPVLYESIKKKIKIKLNVTKY